MGCGSSTPTADKGPIPGQASSGELRAPVPVATPAPAPAAPAAPAAAPAAPRAPVSSLPPPKNPPVVESPKKLHRGQTIPDDIRGSVDMTDSVNKERGEAYFKMLLAGGQKCQTSGCQSAAYLIQHNGYCTKCNRQEKTRSDTPHEVSTPHVATFDQAKSQRELAVKAAASGNDSFNKHSNKQHDEYIRMVAARLHQLWRDLRKRKNGTYEPRVKVVHVEGAGKGKDEKYDIANLDYDHLPELFQKDNREAAEVACEQVKNEVGTLTDVRASNNLLGAEFLERASAMQHEEWMKRAKSRTDMEVDPSLMVSYHRLPEPEREKCRVIVREAIRLYRLWCLRSPEKRWLKFGEGDRVQALA